MPHIHWVARQNKLEIPRDSSKEEVNKREIRESDGRAHDPDTMVAPLTPKPTRKALPDPQGAADHCLKSRRRRYTEEVAIAPTSLRELHS